MSMESIITFLLSPTYFYADYRKNKVEKASGKTARTKLIKKYNKRYLLASMILAFGLGTTYQWNEYPEEYPVIYSLVIGSIIWLFPFSRSNEIFYAFIKDALDKVSHKESHSELKFSDRIRLALNSYLELVVNFGIIFYLLPCEWFNTQLESMIDALYFSGVTITTLGYGDYSSVHFVPQFLVVYEVFCGFILLIVSFAIYSGRGLNERA